jgi:tryptophan synthase alpha chain
MTRLSSAFAKPHPALVCFLTAGDGDTAANLDALVAGGADVIELGMPFTDPMADGPAIQKANIRSLGAGTTTADVLGIAAMFRARHPDVPLVLMGYANPMVRRGPEWFAEAASEVGIDGVICVDIPPEEDDALGPARRGGGHHRDAAGGDRIDRDECRAHQAGDRHSRGRGIRCEDARASR